MLNLKLKIYKILDVAEKGDKASRYFDIFIITFIILNILAVMLQTIDSLGNTYGAFFRFFEIISIIIFSVEYVLRIWSCSSAVDFKGNAFSGRLRYAVKPFPLIDLLAILPFYLPMFISCDLRFIRAIRLFRIFRLFKLGRYSNTVKTFANVFKEQKEELVITLVVGGILLILASSMIYYLEHDAQPEIFSSIPASMWWGVATLTTVGYGDVYPVTTLGKVLGAVIAVLGIGMFALPAGILGSGLVDEIQKKKGKKKCPHCGKVLKD